METETKYTPIEDGYHDCRIAHCRRAERHFGHDIDGHVVFEMFLVPTDTGIENPAAYKAEVAVVLMPGMEWDFYDKTSGKGVWRSVTSSDTADAFEKAQKCFPSWREYCETLTDAESEMAFAWFANPDLTGGVSVRAKLRNEGTYTGSDGMEHPRLKATIVPPFESKTLVNNEEMRAIGNALKAAGVKLFGAKSGAKNGAKAATATATATANAPKPPSAPAPKPTAAKKTVDEAREAAWVAYQAAHAEDKTGARFYSFAASVIGTPETEFEKWTANDWERVEEKCLPF